MGTDIQPDIYVGRTGTGAFDSCYWARLSGATGDFDEIIANGTPVGQFYVEIKATDAYFQTGCEITPIGDWPKPTEALTKVEAGMYMVGRDIAHGIYAGFADEGLSGSCYWARLSNALGDIDGVLTNGNAEGQFYVEIQDTDAYFQTGCEITALAEWPSPDQPHTTVLQGMYLIGRDIGPGTYRGEGGQGILDSCYYARLSGLSGELDDLITNNNATGQFYVTVEASDYALQTKCKLTLTDE